MREKKQEKGQRVQGAMRSERVLSWLNQPSGLPVGEKAPIKIIDSSNIHARDGLALLDSAFKEYFRNPGSRICLSYTPRDPAVRTGTGIFKIVAIQVRPI
jgi:hypothetical protein